MTGGAAGFTRSQPRARGNACRRAAIARAGTAAPTSKSAPMRSDEPSTARTRTLATRHLTASDRLRRRRWCSTATACNAGSAPARSAPSGWPATSGSSATWRSRSCRASGSSAAASSARPGRPPGSRIPAIVTLYEAAVDDDGRLPGLRAGPRRDARRIARGGPAVRPRHRRPSRWRCATRSSTPTPRASSTATSSPPTCSCPRRRRAPAAAGQADRLRRRAGASAATRSPAPAT